jgi:hemolysin activation/secretion protein
MFLKLAPESIRLRRMVRALAAGEISEAEYRRVRREIIDTFTTLAPDHDDKTQPRWRDDSTLRRSELPAEVRPEPRQAAAVADGSRRWRWLVVLGATLIAALLALPESRAAAAEVPPVSQREPDPAGSPRLPVRQVQVIWGGADTAAVPAKRLPSLQARADRVLEDVRARNVPASHGFTAAELEEVARFLNVLGVHQGDRTLDADDARELAALIDAQKQRRGISIAELEEVARAVQAELREQGYFLAVAYLPAQRPADGAVRIEVLPGTLGDIVVEGGKPRLAASAFAGLVGRPVTRSDVAGRMAALNALPGVTAQASFAPGAAVGETRLRLDVLERRSWAADVTYDNHGDDATGEHRLGVNASWLSPRGVGDVLSTGALVTFDPANQTYGFLEYETPLGDDYRISAAIANNDFSLDAPGGFDGDGLYLEVAARRALLHDRSAGLTLVYSAARHILEWVDGADQTVTLGGVGAVGHRVWDGPRIAGDLAVNVAVGRVDGDRFAGQDATFWLLEFDADAWMPVRLPLPGDDQKLRVRLAGQWTDGLLPATRRFALGGAHRSRGFDRSAFLADRAVLLGVEARTPAPVGEMLLFTETAYGDDLAGGGRIWAHLSTVGIGWEAELLPGLSSRLSWSVPFSARSNDAIDDDASRLYWSLRYAH